MSVMINEKSCSDCDNPPIPHKNFFIEYFITSKSDCKSRNVIKKFRLINAFMSFLQLVALLGVFKYYDSKSLLGEAFLLMIGLLTLARTKVNDKIANLWVIFKDTHPERYLDIN